METSVIVLFAFGLVMLVAPLSMCKDLRRKKRRTARAMGTVEDHEEQTSRAGHGAGSSRMRTDHAVIRFTVNDQTRTCVSSTGATWIVHPVGAQVEVCYDPADADNADTVPGVFSDLLEKFMVWGFPLIGLLLLAYAISQHIN